MKKIKTKIHKPSTPSGFQSLADAEEVEDIDQDEDNTQTDNNNDIELGNYSTNAGIGGKTTKNENSNANMIDENNKNNNNNDSNKDNNLQNNNINIENDTSWRAIMCHLIPMTSVNFGHFIIEGSLVLLIPLYVSEILNDTDSVAGLLMTMSSLGALIFYPFVGHWQSKTSNEFILIIGILIRTLSVLFIGIICNINLNELSLIFTGICCFIYGISTACLLVGLSSYISQHVSAIKRGRFSTIVMCFRRFGMVLGPLAAGLITDFISVQAAFYFTAILSALGMIVLCCCVVPPSMHIHNNNNNNDNNDNNINNQLGHWDSFSFYYKESFSSRMRLDSWMDLPMPIENNNNTKNVLNNNNNKNKNNNKNSKNKYTMWQVLKQNWKILLILGIYIFTQNFVRATRRIILTFQGEYIGLSSTKLGYVNSYSYIPDTCLFFVAGYLMDRFGRKYAAIPSLLVFTIASAIVSYCHTYETLIFCGLLYGVGDGIATGLLLTISADIAPSDCRGQFLGIYRMITVIPGVICPTVIGYLTTYQSIFMASMVTASIGIFGIIWMALIVEEPLKISQRYEQLKQLEINEKNTQLVISDSNNDNENMIINNDNNNHNNNNDDDDDDDDNMVSGDQFLENDSEKDAIR